MPFFKTREDITKSHKVSLKNTIIHRKHDRCRPTLEANGTIGCHQWPSRAMRDRSSDRCIYGYIIGTSHNWPNIIFSRLTSNNHPRHFSIQRVDYLTVITSPATCHTWLLPFLSIILHLDSIERSMYSFIFQAALSAIFSPSSILSTNEPALIFISLNWSSTLLSSLTHRFSTLATLLSASFFHLHKLSVTEMLSLCLLTKSAYWALQVLGGRTKNLPGRTLSGLEFAFFDFGVI